LKGETAGVSARGLAIAAGLGLVLAAGTPPAPLRAQIFRPHLELSPYAGVLHPGGLDLQELSDAPILGARAGVRLPGGLAIEAQLGYAPLDSDIDPALGGGSFDVTAWLYEAGLAFALPIPGPLVPFIGISGGQARFDPDLERDGREVGAESSFVLGPGAGVRLSLGGLHLRGDLREHLVIDGLDDVNRALSPGSGGGESFHMLEASVGLSLLF
jgi:hypothetical protein